MKRAWRTTWNGIVSIIAAETRGQAVSRTLNSACEAGWPAKFTAVKAVRAPEFDGWAEQDQSKTPWSEEHLASTRIA